jgi:L-ascorbate metabolism protein UlaG (beta-lactamase superfamily)
MVLERRFEFLNYPCHPWSISQLLAFRNHIRETSVMQRGSCFTRYFRFLLAACTFPALVSAQNAANEKGAVTIEYIAHACFRLTSPSGKRVLIDPYASRVWLGYDFPADLRADAVLISHPHYDHDGGEAMHRKVPWPSNTLLLRTPGTNQIGDVTVAGFAGKHADPWGKEFGQSNTIWLVEIAGLRMVHVGDNGPLAETTIGQLGRVDVLMMPIDSQFHILKADEIAAIRKKLSPAVLIPMHYRHDDLEMDSDKPEKLGGIDGWAKTEANVRYLSTNKLELSAATLPTKPEVLILKHSPLVQRPTPSEATSVPAIGAMSLVGPAISFRTIHHRWPKDYGELLPMLKPAGDKREKLVKFAELPDGSLEISSVDQGQTNRLTLPIQDPTRR